jgi:hypothetical protein
MDPCDKFKRPVVQEVGELRHLSKAQQMTLPVARLDFGPDKCEPPGGLDGDAVSGRLALWAMARQAQRRSVPLVVHPGQRRMSTGVGLFLLASILLAGCIRTGPLSRKSALSTAAHAPGVVRVERSSAKLMTWQEWQTGSGNLGGPIPGPAPSQSVWVVALKGTFLLPRTGSPRGMVVILDALSGNVIMETTGSSDWPPYWDSLPDSGAP